MAFAPPMNYYAVAAAGHVPEVDDPGRQSRFFGRAPSRVPSRTIPSNAPVAASVPVVEKTNNPVVRTRIAAEYASLRFQVSLYYAPD
jgi:hypothetical protein